MSEWGLAVDCAHSGALAEFWALALGYEHLPPPEGFANWGEWLRSMDVPEEEWDDGAYLRGPGAAGGRPRERARRPGGGGAGRGRRGNGPAARTCVTRPDARRPCRS